MIADQSSEPLLPSGSEGKESACNAGDPGLIPGSGSSPGEGISYPLQYSWVSLVAQMITCIYCIAISMIPTLSDSWYHIRFRTNV